MFYIFSYKTGINVYFLPSLQSQYRFVCEAIQRVYSEGLVKPLAEYQQR